MSDNNEFGSFLSGFLVGGLVGAAVALLMAPQSGEETRTLIGEKTAWGHWKHSVDSVQSFIPF